MLGQMFYLEKQRFKILNGNGGKESIESVKEPSLYIMTRNRSSTNSTDVEDRVEDG